MKASRYHLKNWTLVYAAYGWASSLFSIAKSQTDLATNHWGLYQWKPPQLVASATPKASISSARTVSSCACAKVRCQIFFELTTADPDIIGPMWTVSSSGTLAPG